MSLGTTLATASVEIRADNDKFAADMKQTEQLAKKTGASVLQIFAQAFGAVAFAAGIKKSIDAASNLNETISKSKIIFGEAAGEMEKMGESAARSMGMSKRAYLDAASGLKGLLDNMGLTADESTRWSQDMTGLGADLASFFNTDPADAIYAIGAALRGESEPIRRYNVQLTDLALKAKAAELGLYEGKGALDANAKAQASLALIMEQTSAAQGDFTRTADGVANQQRINKALAEDSAASFGQVLLPVMQRVLQVVGFLSEGFGSLPAPVQIAVVALAGFVALSGPVDSLVSVMKTLINAFTGMSSAAKTASLAVGAIGAILTVAMLAYSQYSDYKAKAAQTTKDFVDALTAEAAGQKDATTALIAGKLATKEIADLMGDFGVSAQEVADFITGKSVPALDQLTAQYGSMGLAAATAGDDLGAAARGFEISSVDASVLSLKVLELQTAFISAKDQIALTGAVTEALGIETDITAASVAGMAEVTKGYRDQLESVTQGLIDYRLELENAAGGAFNLESATLDLADATADQAIKQQEVNDILADSTSTDAEKAKALRELRQGQIDNAGAALNMAQAYAESTGAAEGTVESIQAQINMLSILKGQYPELASDIQVMIDKLLAAPGVIDPAAEAIGGSISEGIGRGIDGSAYIAADAARRAVQGAFAAAVAAGRIKSPSRLFAEGVGQPIAAGIAEGIVEDSHKIDEALRRAIESAAKAAVEATGAAVSVTSSALSGFWGGIDDARSEADMREAIADAQESLNEAMESADPEKIADANERLADANYRLAKATQDMILVDAGARASWVATAAAAGLTVQEIDGIIAATMRLTQAKADAAAESEAINAEAAAAQATRTRFNEAVGQGLVSSAQMKKLGAAQGSGGQLAFMEQMLASLDAFFAGISGQFAASGYIADRPTLGVWGEAGREAILPLTRQSDLSRILTDPRVRGPVEKALGAGGSMQGMSGSSVPAAGGATLNIERVYVASDLDAEILGRTASFLLAGRGVG